MKVLLVLVCEQLMGWSFRKAIVEAQNQVALLSLVELILKWPKLSDERKKNHMQVMIWNQEEPGLDMVLLQIAREQGRRPM